MAASVSKKRGQSLVEILIAMTVGALIVASAAGALIFTVRSNQENRSSGTASSLAQELLDNVRSVSQSDWQSIYSVAPKGGPTQACPPYCYYLDSGGSSFVVTSGSEEIGPINNVTYTRYFTVENVNRDSCGAGSITSAPEMSCDGQPADVLEDPSTQKITAKVIWSQGETRELVITEFITRSRNEITQFTDWSGGEGVEGPFERPSTGYSSQVGLDTTTVPGSIVLSDGGSGGGSGTGMEGGHWDAINEVVSDGSSSYVYSFSSVEQVDYYTLEDPSGSAFISGVLLHVEGDGCVSTLYFRLGVDVSSAPQPGGCTNLGNSMSGTLEQTISRPGGGSWTWTDINNLQVGVGIKTGPGYPGALTTVFVQVLATGNPIVRPDSDVTANIEGVYDISGDDFTDHWGKVDEPLPDHNKTNYIYTTSITEKRDIYTLNNPSVTGTTINSVVVGMYYDGCDIKPYLILGSNEIADTSGGGICNSTGGSVEWTQHISPSMSRPGGGSWVWADLNDLQVGAGVRRQSAGSSQNGEIDMVYVKVNYDSGSYVILRPDADVATNIENTVP